MKALPRVLGRPTLARSVALAVLLPAAAVVIGVALDRRSTIAGTSLCLLAVMLASVYGGRRGGLAASVVAFLALNVFFTEPYHSLSVHRLADLIALIVFLGVSLLVGTLVARMNAERESAERRISEVRLLDRATARLLRGDSIEDVLIESAAELVLTLDLARCEVRLSDRDPIMATGSPADDGGPRLDMVIDDVSAGGSVVAVRPTGGPPFSAAERSFVQAFTGHVALAVQRASLDDEVTRARVESEASRLRAALFSAVTHDLRTPLASIKAGASGLLDEAASYSPGQRREALGTIIEEADRLNRLVANLLDLARMRAGALRPSREPVWLADVLGRVVGRLGRVLEPFDVRVSLRADLPPVAADPVQIDQVLTNVLENAARFSRLGGTIDISGAPWHDLVRVRIADEGPGIAPELREKVFEEFYRSDAGRGRGGTGLGLAIARAIIDAHQGRIWVEGTPAGGAALIIELRAVPTDDRLPTSIQA